MLKLPADNTDLDTSIFMVIEGLGGAMSQVQQYHLSLYKQNIVMCQGGGVSIKSRQPLYGQEST